MSRNMPPLVTSHTEAGKAYWQEQVKSLAMCTESRGPVLHFALDPITPPRSIA